jgi:endonuclease/exonuclease/phosphatase family metal-dependent hydrolase
MKYLLFTFLFFSYSIASETTFLTYNILNYSDDDSREQNYISILDEIQPDLIVVQEIIGQNGYENFKTGVLDILNPSMWSSAPFINQSAQQDIALFYKHDIFNFLSTQAINTAQSPGTRDVIEWVMTHHQSDLSFNIYGVHLKASSGNSNATQRLQEVTILRNHLNNLDQNTRFIVAGDFNIYSNNSNSEPAFDMLTSEGENPQGQLFDPINRIGHWHNNSSYADVHTQSPRTTSFGGGANGGMDDRFDWLFVSESILSPNSEMYYIENTYNAFGNDGNHFNGAIIDGNNSGVSNDIASALHSASDHLPVSMNIWFNDLVYGDSSIVISEIMVNPASVSDSYGEWFELINVSIDQIDLNGWIIKDSQDNQHIIDNSENSLWVLPGEYLVLTRNDNSASNGGVVGDYTYSGISLSNSEDAITLINDQGAIVDQVEYNSDWPFSSGVSMELHDVLSQNNEIVNWFSAFRSYGDGDLGTPGLSYNDTLNIYSYEKIPERFNLSNPYPNPFNSSTNLKIENPNFEVLQLEIYNIKGEIIQSIKNKNLLKENSIYMWNANDYPSGIYFFELSSSKKSIIKKSVYLK